MISKPSYMQAYQEIDVLFVKEISRRNASNK
jgi:hypothetical protein